MRTLIVSALLMLGAVAARAQMPGSAAKAAAQKAAAATSAHIEAEQSPTAQQPAPTKASATKTQAAPSKTSSSKTASTKAAATKAAPTAGKKGSTAPATPAADTSGPPPTIWREAFVYDAAHRRDPFNSLLTTNELRPTLSDLKITGILFDPAGRRSFATLRDLVTNAQYRVTNGTTLGRMRVAAIRTKIVVFTIDEFGTTRQDSLVFGDTTKARVK